MVRILIIFIICISLNVKAQLVDLIGNLSIQSSIDQESTRSVEQGLSTLQKVKVLQDIQQIATEIQISYFGNYQSISKNNLSKNYLSQINWNLKPKKNGFYIQLNQINKNLCNYLIQNKIVNTTIQINENNNKNCNELNIIKYYFE